MVRTILATLAIVAFVAASAHADLITVDGSIADWTAAGLVHTDNIPDNSPHDVQITAYGATISNGTFYAFVQYSQPVSNFNALYPGAWIDVDHNAATYSGNPQLGSGVDIDLEYDQNSPTDISLNYWGGADINNDSISAGSSYAAAGNVVEFSAPVSAINAALGALNTTFPGSSMATAGNYPWEVYIASDGWTSADWNPDNAGRCVVSVPVAVPEPGTFVLLAAGLAGLLCYAWRKRK